MEEYRYPDLDDVLEILKSMRDDDFVRAYVDGRTVYLTGDIGSYRGAYVDVYVGYTHNIEEAGFAGEILDKYEKFIARGTMEGYKGGWFDVNGDCGVYLANYGLCGDRLYRFEAWENVFAIEEDF